MNNERFRLYNKLCDSCTRYDDCNKLNACKLCKKLRNCDRFKEYSNEYYNIFEHDTDEELLTEEELRDIFTHDNNPKFCTHFDCEEYEEIED